MMTPEGKQKLKALLIQHEEMKNFPYVDSTNHLTIGVGRNLTTRGISNKEGMVLLDDDMEYFQDQLTTKLPWFIGLTEPRQIALIDMCFNLGVNGLLGFSNMLKNLEDGLYAMAASDMLDSKWAIQVNERAVRLATIIQTGEL